ncbi:MAG: BrnT family toxin [Nitrospirae bacterium]|nr:BrnT family toxin [Nitrospirota bacterium]
MFTWDIPKAIANFEKHGVPFEEATTVFADSDTWMATTQNARRTNVAVSASGDH